MRRAISIGSVIMILAAVVFAGNDPWKAKPYQQWDEKDVRKILGESPWSKAIEVSLFVRRRDLPETGTVGGGAPVTLGRAPSQPAAPDAPTLSASPPQSGPDDVGGSALIDLHVRWVSSRTLQRAAVRGAELAGQMKPEEAEKQLASVPDVYEVAVIGTDMRPFRSADEDTLKLSAALIDKNSKQKISPSKVEISRSADGKKVQAVTFSFPKKAGNGEPAIPEDEKSVDFNCDINGAKIRASFDISKMQDSQGRDL